MKYHSLAILFLVSLLFVCGNSSPYRSQRENVINTYVVGEIVNQASIPVYVKSPSLQSGVWIKQVSSPMTRGNNYWQMFIVAGAGEVEGEVEISSVQGGSGVTLEFYRRAGSGLFRVSGSTPGLSVVNEGILPPYENHDQSLLHGRVTINDA